MIVAKGSQQVKEFSVKFRDGRSETFEEGILICGKIVKKDKKIGYGVNAISTIPGSKAGIYLKAIDVLTDELKKEVEKGKERFEEFK